MIEGKTVLTVVPGRGGSKGLPGKNIRMLCGRPLIAWSILAAKQSRYVDKVIVSTDDAAIARVASETGAEVPFVRPAPLASDTAPSSSVLRHALEFLRHQAQVFDYILLLEPTSPLTEASDVDSALLMLHEARATADSIVGISPVTSAHPEFSVRLGSNGLISPYLQGAFSSPKRRQDVDPVYFLEGSLYASAVDSFLSKGSFYHERTLGYVVPKWKSFEVDDLVDLICIEALMTRRHELREAYAPDR